MNIVEEDMDEADIVDAKDTPEDIVEITEEPAEANLHEENVDDIFNADVGMAEKRPVDDSSR